MKPAKRGRTTDLFPIWLIRSKVSPTRQRMEMLNRESIIHDMARGTDATLSLVHAPAGYGKSTLLSLWRRKLLDEGHRVCWLSLGKEDNAVNQLLTYILYSLHENGLDLRAGGTRIESNLSEFSPRLYQPDSSHYRRADGESRIRVRRFRKSRSGLHRRGNHTATAVRPGKHAYSHCHPRRCLPENR
ncbi:hypothetical protein [Kineobactrum salinum]|uniref:hypothetical protein n=1 Tax=Kineobactrum salinum TaxID=2708301 RepID=UPI001E41667C|nr:hypothetical protein [Kineobactrum salinum]